MKCTVEFQYTEGPGHATQLAREGARNECKSLIAVGGDGTVNEVARGIINSKVPMGIIPNGSGNGLARHLGIPMRIGKAVDMLFESEVVQMDTFTINDRLSLNISGIGFDGHVAKLFGHNGKRGLLNYAKIVLNEYTHFDEFEADLRPADKKDPHRRKAFIIAIANSSQYGNNIKIAPDVSICSHKLQVSVIRKIPLTRPNVIFALLKGKIKHSSYYEVFESQSMTIKASAPIEYHVDGEPCGKDDTFNIRILPSSLGILVPAKMCPRV
jgi:YegS/Rv2252/BmrU family lipid kinase